MVGGAVLVNPIISYFVKKDMIVFDHRFFIIGKSFFDRFYKFLHQGIHFIIAEGSTYFNNEASPDPVRGKMIYLFDEVRAHNRPDGGNVFIYRPAQDIKNQGIWLVINRFEFYLVDKAQLSQTAQGKAK